MINNFIHSFCYFINFFNNVLLFVLLFNMSLLFFHCLTPSSFVGQKTPTYDIWGSTVNIANRMETTGQPGEIHLSSDAHLQIQHHFNFQTVNTP